MKLRIGTFNGENLFSRPRVLNYASDEKAVEPLAHIAVLDRILAKPTYSSFDKKRILDARGRAQLLHSDQHGIGSKAGSLRLDVGGAIGCRVAPLLGGEGLRLAPADPPAPERVHVARSSAG